MELNVTLTEIQGLATNGRVFTSGKIYAEEDHITQMFFDSGDQRLDAYVRSLDRLSTYKVQIWVNGRLRPRRVTCNCPDSHQYLGCCKHSVAVMLHATHIDLDHLPLPPGISAPAAAASPAGVSGPKSSRQAASPATAAAKPKVKKVGSVNQRKAAGDHSALSPAHKTAASSTAAAAAGTAGKKPAGPSSVDAAIQAAASLLKPSRPGMSKSGRPAPGSAMPVPPAAAAATQANVPAGGAPAAPRRMVQISADEAKARLRLHAATEASQAAATAAAADAAAETGSLTAKAAAATEEATFLPFIPQRSTAEDLEKELDAERELADEASRLARASAAATARLNAPAEADTSTKYNPVKTSSLNGSDYRSLYGAPSETAPSLRQADLDRAQALGLLRSLQAALNHEQQPDLRQELMLQFYLQLPLFGSELALLELKIGLADGEGRFYKIKQLQTFLDACDQGRSLVFGKDLTFTPDRQRFDARSQEVLDWLLYQYHNQLEPTGTAYEMISPLLRRQQVLLNPARLTDFLLRFADLAQPEVKAAQAEGTQPAELPPQPGQAATPEAAEPETAPAEAAEAEAAVAESDSESAEVSGRSEGSAGSSAPLADQTWSRLEILAAAGSVVRAPLSRDWPPVSFCIRQTDSHTEAAQAALAAAAQADGRPVPDKPVVLELLMTPLGGSPDFPVNIYNAETYQKSHAQHSLRLLNRDATLLLYDNRLYAPAAHRQSLGQVYRSLAAAAPRHRLLFAGHDASLFLTRILPRLDQLTAFVPDQALAQRLRREPLSTRLYFDKAGRGLSADLRFVYGDLEINPHPQWHETDPARIDQLEWLLRDEASESRTLSRLKEAGFREQRPGHASLLSDPSGQPDTHYYLYGDRKLYLFLRDGLAALQADGAELFYAERFRQLKLLPMGKLGADISLDSSGSLLTVDMGTNQYEPEELVAILQAYREKKHFIRLKDGAFIELEAQDEKTLDVLQEVEKWGGSWEGQTLNLPAFRAVPLQELLSQQGLLPPASATGTESLAAAAKQTQAEDSPSGPGLRLDPAFVQLHTALQDPADLAFELPDGLQTILRSYQKAGFRWLCLLNTYHCGGILADDMGLGKTLQTLSFIRYLREAARQPADSGSLPENQTGQDGPPPTITVEGPAIVVAPTSLIYNWQDEARRFTPELKCLVIEGSKEQRLQQIEQLDSCDLAIFSYTVLRQDIKELAEHRFSCCILDEAQAIKNPLTQTAKAVKRIQAGRRYALTGTPIENALSELWSIFDFLMPGYLFSYTRFHQEYELPVTRSGEEAQLAAERLRMLVSPFILRRMKRDVLKELPDKIESVLRCDMTPEQDRLYQAYLARARNELEELIASRGLSRSRMQILALLTRLRQLACHPSLFLADYDGGSGKLDALEELLDNLLASNHRILIFSQFTSMLSIIRQRQVDRGRKLFYIDGHVEARERLEQVRRFNEGEGEIFLISLKAGGTGLNLVGADTVIHYDPWWNPAVEQQATDRAHRIGQKRVVQIYRLISRGTIEEKILAFQDEKRRLVDRVIQPGEPLLKQLDLNQLRDLFTTD
ncbi:hypothetical protein HCH52_06465 [Oscillospiraceae bacterium HV4-5-C5C]|nr:hypothetical protein [Oscillospiraceae bacterium HV4-5-C5C]